MTDTEHFEKTPTATMGEQKVRKEEGEEKKDPTPTGPSIIPGTAGTNQDTQKDDTNSPPDGETVTNDDGGQDKSSNEGKNNDDANDMSLVEEAKANGMGPNMKGYRAGLNTDDIDAAYAGKAGRIREKYDEERKSAGEAPQRNATEEATHQGDIRALENDYRVDQKEDVIAAKERVGVKEVLEVPNYRSHISDERMQGWGRALASFGSVGLKEGANAIDAATKALGEFRKLTRAFLSPNPMSAPSQMLASTMVGMSTMYDTIDRAGEIAGIKQGADKSIVMETAKGAQYYKDKDRATQAANFMMQSFNDQIRDTLGPKGDVTQLNPAQFKRIYEKMETAWAPEIERIQNEHRAGRPATLEDKAIMEGWKSISDQYVKNLRQGAKTAREYGKEIGEHEKALKELDKDYNRQLKDYNKVISDIDKRELAEQRMLGQDYKSDVKNVGKEEKAMETWQKGYDEAVKNNDRIGALLRVTLGPEAQRRLRDGNVIMHTLYGAQDEANSNARNPNYTPEQQAVWLKIADVFGKRAQEVKNMSAEQRRQYARSLAGPSKSPSSKQIKLSKEQTVTTTPLMSKKDLNAAVSKRKDTYVADRLSDWMGEHRYNPVWGGNPRKAGAHKAAKALLNNIFEREYETYRLMDMGKISEGELRNAREEIKGLQAKVLDIENRLDTPSKRLVRGNIRADESLRATSDAQVREGKRVFFSPHAIGEAMRGLDTQADKDEFIRRAMHEAGIWAPNPEKKSGYQANLKKLQEFLDFEIENMVRDPEALGDFYDAIVRYNWGPKGRSILADFKDKIADKTRLPWDEEDSTPLDTNNPKVLDTKEEEQKNEDYGVIERESSKDDTDYETNLQEKADISWSKNMFYDWDYTDENISKLYRYHDLLDREELEQLIEWIDRKAPVSDKKAQDLRADAKDMIFEIDNPAEPEDGDEEGYESDNLTDTLENDLRRLSKEELEERISQLKGLEQDDEVTSLTDMAQNLLNQKKERDEVKEEAIDESAENNVPESEPVITDEEDVKLTTASAKKLAQMLDDALGSGDEKRVGEIISRSRPLSIGIGKTSEELKYVLGKVEEGREALRKLLPEGTEEEIEKNKEALKNGPNVPKLEPAVRRDYKLDPTKFREPGDDSRKADSAELNKELSYSDGTNPSEIVGTQEHVDKAIGGKNSRILGMNPEIFSVNEAGKIKWTNTTANALRPELLDLENKTNSLWKSIEKVSRIDGAKSLRKEAIELYEEYEPQLKYIEDHFKTPGEKTKTKQRLDSLMKSFKKLRGFAYADNPEKLGDVDAYFTTPELKHKEKSTKGPQPLDDDTERQQNNGAGMPKGKGAEQKPENEPAKKEVKRPTEVTSLVNYLNSLKGVKNVDNQKKDAERNDRLNSLNEKLKVWKKDLKNPELFKTELQKIADEIRQTLPKHLEVSINPNTRTKPIISIVNKKQENHNYNGEKKILEDIRKGIDFIKNFPSVSDEDFEKRILVLEQNVLQAKELNGKLYGYDISDDFKKKYEEMLKELDTDNRHIKINWDNLRQYNHLSVKKPESEESETESEVKDTKRRGGRDYQNEMKNIVSSGGEPDSSLKQWMKRNKESVRAAFNGKDDEMLKKFPFLKSATPSFRDMLAKRFDESHKNGYFMG